MLTGMAFLFQLVLLGGEAGFAVNTLLRDGPAFRVPLLSNVSDQGAQNFYSALRSESFVREAKFVTREQTLEEERRTDASLASFLDRYGLQNPFPDTVVLRLRSLDDLPGFTAFLQKEEWQAVVDPSFLSQANSQELESASTLAIANAAGIVAWFSLIFTIFALLAGVAAFLRGRALLRRDELLLLRLLGERPLFQRMPFAIEAFTLLFFAFALSTLLVFSFLTILPVLVPAFAITGPLGAFYQILTALLTAHLPTIFFLELAMLALIAIIGAWVGVKHPKFLSFGHSV